MPVSLGETENKKLVSYLTWHCLADEVVCNGVAMGLRHAPSREARSMLLRQMREEYSHHTFMARLIQEHGGTLPETLPEMEPVVDRIMDIADGGWLQFLVGFAVTMDGIYGYPWSKAIGTATIRDERYFRFYDTVLFPQEIGHYNFAQKSLRVMIADEDTDVLQEIVTIARDCYPVYVDFISSSFPYLEEVGCETTQILPHMEQIKNTYWPKEFGVSLDAALATPDSDVEYGPGM